MLPQPVDVLHSKITEAMGLYNKTRYELLSGVMFNATSKLHESAGRLHDNPIINNVKYSDDIEFIDSKLENISNNLANIIGTTDMFSDGTEFVDLLHMQIDSLGKLSEMIDKHEELYPEIKVIPDRIISNCEHIKTVAGSIADQAEDIADEQVYEPLDDLKFAAKSLSKRLADETDTVNSDDAIYVLESIIRRVTENIAEPLTEECRYAYDDISEQFNANLEFVIDVALDVKLQLAGLDYDV